MAGETLPPSPIAGYQPAESDRQRVESEAELSAELREFIDRLIVPLLVERLMAETGHLYSAAPSYYDGEKRIAAQEAA